MKSINSFAINLIGKSGKVNFRDFLALQNNLITPAAQGCFTPTYYQYFHVDGGTNVHATNQKEDFIINYPNPS